MTTERTITVANYRCYFTDAADRIQSYEQIACPDDAAAALKVQQLLAASTYSSAELWQGKRLVGKWAASGGGYSAEAVRAAGDRSYEAG
jgi:hypothetical protein